MINCDFFEDNLNSWKAGKLPADQMKAMEQHSMTCPYCGKLSAETIKLRVHLATLPRNEPSSTFEFRLQRKLADIRNSKRTTKVNRKGLLPRWSVVGAGLVTGIAVGILLIFPSNPEKGMITMVENTPAVADTDPQSMSRMETEEVKPMVKMTDKNFQILRADESPGGIHLRGSRAGAVGFQADHLTAAGSRDAVTSHRMLPETVANVFQIQETPVDSTEETDSIKVMEIPFDPDRHAQTVSHEKE